MKIVKVTVTNSTVNVKYERKTGYCTYRYNVAPDNVLEYMFNANHIKHMPNGNIVYRTIAE